MGQLRLNSSLPYMAQLYSSFKQGVTTMMSGVGTGRIMNTLKEVNLDDEAISDGVDAPLAIY